MIQTPRYLGNGFGKKKSSDHFVIKGDQLFITGREIEKEFPNAFNEYFTGILAGLIEQFETPGHVRCSTGRPFVCCNFVGGGGGTDCDNSLKPYD